MVPVRPLQPALLVPEPGVAASPTPARPCPCLSQHPCHCYPHQGHPHCAAAHPPHHVFVCVCSICARSLHSPGPPAHAAAAATNGTSCFGPATGGAMFVPPAPPRTPASWSTKKPHGWLTLDNPYPDLGAVPAPASFPSEVQAPALTSAFPLLALEDLIWETTSALISALSSICFVNSLLYEKTAYQDTGSLIKTQENPNSGFGDGEEGWSGILAWLYPEKEQGIIGVYFPGD